MLFEFDFYLAGDLSKLISSANLRFYSVPVIFRLVILRIFVVCFFRETFTFDVSRLLKKTHESFYPRLK